MSRLSPSSTLAEILSRCLTRSISGETLKISTWIAPVLSACLVDGQWRIERR